MFINISLCNLDEWNDSLLHGVWNSIARCFCAQSFMTLAIHMQPTDNGWEYWQFYKCSKKGNQFGQINGLLALHGASTVQTLIPAACLYKVFKLYAKTWHIKCHTSHFYYLWSNRNILLSKPILCYVIGHSIHPIKQQCMLIETFDCNCIGEMATQILWEYAGWRRLSSNCFRAGKVCWLAAP